MQSVFLQTQIRVTMGSETKRSFSAVLLLLMLLFTPLQHSLSQDLSNVTVTLKAANKPLHAVLDDLTVQTGYYFTFDSRLTDSRKRVSVDLKDVPMQTVIDTLFEIPGLSWRIINKNIVLFPLSTEIQTIGSDTVEIESNLLKVRGTVTDLKSEKPLAYATIAVMDTYYGTISNEDGRFILLIPDTLNQPILVSSYIGYRNHYIPISVASDELVEIRMNRNLISLQEVIIRYQDPAGLLSEAIKRIPKNYLAEASGMQAYYREKVNKDDKTMIFSEAVVEIAKAPYTGSLTPERSRILKGRKITDIELQDTVVFKIRSGLSTMLQLDIIKNPPDFLSENFPLLYDLRFSDVVSFKDKLVYVISFRQKESIDETLFRGNLYIDRETLAIIAADFEYDPVRLGREERMFVTKKSRGVKIRPASAGYHVEYKMSGDALHLSQVQGKVVFKVRKKRQWIASKYEISLELAITHTNPGNPPQIRYSEQLKPSTIMSEQQFEYDPDFWGDYTTITPEASLTEALKMIEKSMLEVNLQE
jgi:uncharacterized protein YxjI